MMTGFTALTDRPLRPIRDAVLQADDRVVVCATADRNGDLPTHNAEFSKPQRSDPVRNAVDSSNRRVFDDRVGLKAGRNSVPFPRQVYRRVRRAGTFMMMQDLSAPIIVREKHWGGLRLAHRV